ncbi:MAG: YraN family protein [Prevotella sp.]|jgi:putative endonuclease|nr:YraN family protein [Prevotella sp.]
MAFHNKIGDRGEEVAANYLVEKGYVIIERNRQFRHTDLDIIARNNETLVFVEVKTRMSDEWGYPEEAVTHGKIKRISEAANDYIQKSRLDLAVRFDVISVLVNNGAYEIVHFEDAFLPPAG